MSETEIDTETIETETDWTGEGPPAKKRGIPRWLWMGCGCGCLVVVLGVGAIGFFVKDLVDPEVQWPKLSEVLYFEERPTDLTMTFGVPMPGARMWTLIDDQDGYVATVVSSGAASQAEKNQMFSAEGGAVPGGWGEPSDGKEETLELQGRDVRTLAYSKIKGTGGLPGQGPSLRVDLSGDDGGLRMVELKLTKKTTGAFPEEIIRDFFDHFDVWHGR